MSASTGIALTATAVAVSNEWLHSTSPAPNFRMLFAGLGATLVCSGVDKLSTTAGVGLASLFLIAVLLTPVNGDAPADTVLKLLGSTPNNLPTKGN